MPSIREASQPSRSDLVRPLTSRSPNFGKKCFSRRPSVSAAVRRFFAVSHCKYVSAATRNRRRLAALSRTNCHLELSTSKSRPFCRHIAYLFARRSNGVAEIMPRALNKTVTGTKSAKTVKAKTARRVIKPWSRFSDYYNCTPPPCRLVSQSLRESGFALCKRQGVGLKVSEHWGRQSK